MAHAGHHQRQCTVGPHRCGRIEQQVDRRLAEIYRRAIVDDHHRDIITASDPHVLAARGNVDGTRIDRLAVDRLQYRAPGSAGEMLGENGDEDRRHVLGDQHKRAFEHAADMGENGVERQRTAGGGIDQQHARRHHRHRPQRHDGGHVLRYWMARSDRPRWRVTPPRAQAELANPLDQLAAEGDRNRDVARDGRLGDVVGGAELQRLQADLGVPTGQRRGHDDDKVALPSEQQGPRGHALHLRHVNVEHRDIRVRVFELGYRFAVVAQRPAPDRPPRPSSAQRVRARPPRRRRP